MQRESLGLSHSDRSGFLKRHSFWVIVIQNRRFGLCLEGEGGLLEQRRCLNTSFQRIGLVPGLEDTAGFRNVGELETWRV